MIRAEKTGPENLMNERRASVRRQVLKKEKKRKRKEGEKEKNGAEDGGDGASDGGRADRRRGMEEESIHRG